MRRKPSWRGSLVLAAALAGLVASGCGILDPAASLRLVDRLNPFTWHRTSRTAFVETEDGWKLALERVSPARTRAGRPPVVLAHGLGYNGSFWQVSPELSLPEYLASQGFDVWVLNWRGAGNSSKWVFKLPELAEELDGWKPNRPENVVEKLERFSDAHLANVTTDPKFFSWSLDDYVRYDVPAALDHIEKTTGSKQVLWVGHSMGGNVALAYLATRPEEARRFAGLVTIGSQMTMPENRLLAEYLKELALSRAESFKGVKGFSSALQAAGEPAQELFVRSVNVGRYVLERLERAASDPPGLGVIGQYLEMVESGELKSTDKALNYNRLVEKVGVPILITAGAADRVAPAVAQRQLFKSVGSTDKGLVLFGRDEGFSTDYGHGDAVVGRTAPREVWPVLAEWLRKHS